MGLPWEAFKGATMRTSVLIACALLFAGIGAGQASAGRRLALVIGNSKYLHAPLLRNPANDARDMAEMLQRLGFETVTGLDLD